MNRNLILFGLTVAAAILFVACGGAAQQPSPTEDGSLAALQAQNATLQAQVDSLTGGEEVPTSTPTPGSTAVAIEDSPSLLPTPWVPTPQSGNADNFNDSTITLVEYVKKYAQGAYSKIADYAGNTPIKNFLVAGDYVSVHMEHNQAAWEPRINDIMCFGSVFQYDPALHGDLILPANSTVIWWSTDKLDTLEDVIAGWINLRESYEGWTCSG